MSKDKEELTYEYLEDVLPTVIGEPNPNHRSKPLKRKQSKKAPRKPTRQEVLAFLGRHLELEPSELTDNISLPLPVMFYELCWKKWGIKMSLRTGCTVGRLVRELTK